MVRRFKTWLTDRSGIRPETLHALDKPLPKGVGWLNTLGSTALLVIAVQVITGIFLAMYYSPVPGGAYLSVQYIDQQVLFGKIVRGIHHYGASAAVIVVVLHMLRVIFHGAYKPPRELIWLLGIVILALVMGFGFTGYLLPWDQKAYWATVVGTEIPASVPVIGPVIKAVLRGGEQIGAATLTRFYAIHVLVLPALLAAVVGLHMLFVWIKGPTPPGVRVGEKAPVYSSRFVQHQLFKDAVVMAAVFGIIYLLALLRPPSLEFIANPADPAYTPRPDWYFLFLYQFLKDLGGIAPWLPEWIPAVILPGIALGVLTLLPWLDRSPERHWRKRPLWTGLTALGVVTVVALTARSLADPPENLTPRTAATGTRFPHGIRPEDRPVLARGEQVFFETAKPLACGTCHQIGGRGGTSAMALDNVGNRRTYRWLVEHTRNPQALVPDSTMPAYPPELLSEEDLKAVTDYMVQPTAPKPVLIYQNP